MRTNRIMLDDTGGRRMADDLKIKVNGKAWPVAASPDTPLLYVLSNELRLQGPRFGCGLAQCGYCYNGMIIKGAELLAQNPRPTEQQLRVHMDGHLCRCGTYPRVMKSIQL